MEAKLGFILLDRNEIIIYVYQKVFDKKWAQACSHTYELVPYYYKEIISSFEIRDFLIKIILSHQSIPNIEWHLFGRQIEERMFNEVTLGFNFPCLLLNLSEEQKLLCKGLLFETIKLFSES